MYFSEFSFFQNAPNRRKGDATQALEHSDDLNEFMLVHFCLQTYFNVCRCVSAICQMFFELLGPSELILSVFYVLGLICGNMYPNSSANQKFGISLIFMLGFKKGKFSISNRHRKFSVCQNLMMWVLKSFLTF